MSEETNRLKKIAEAVLFASGDSVSLDQLSKVLSLTPAVCRDLVDELAQDYEAEERGFQILKLENRYQMTTRPIYYDYVKQLYRSEQRISLTETQLETLAIVVYKQPVTRQEIDDIRGVQSDGIINRLVEYDLITEVGRLKAPGRPSLFGTTESFLRNFGFKTLRDIPDLPAESIDRMEQMALADEEMQETLFADEADTVET